MPIFRNFTTEMFGEDINSQKRYASYYNPCSDFELNAHECLEAYGHQRAYIICKPIIDDFLECINNTLSARRVIAMRQERFKQILKGKRPLTKLYGPKVSFSGWSEESWI